MRLFKTFHPLKLGNKEYKTPATCFSAALTSSLSYVRGSGSPTFSRLSTATFTDWEGVVRTCSNNEPRFDGARRVKNLFVYSSSMNTGSWSVGPSTTRIGNAIYIDPNGAATASSFKGSGTATNEYVSQILTLNAKATYTVSIWAKLITGTTPTNGEIISASYNNGTTTVRAAINYSSIVLTSSWQRFSVTFTNVTGGGYSMYFHADTTSTSEVALWGAQIEDVTGQTNPNPGEYVATQGSAVSQWFETQNVNHVVNGIVCLRGNLFNNSTTAPSTFSQNAGTTTANAGIAPDGTNTATKWVPNTSNTTHYFKPSSTQYNNYTNGRWYIASLYVKPTGSITKLVTESPKQCNFDILAGTVTIASGSTPTYATITPAANGYYRISISYQTTSFYAAFPAFFSKNYGSSTGDGTSGFLFCWPQLEEVTGLADIVHPSPYTATTGSQAVIPSSFDKALPLGLFPSGTLKGLRVEGSSTNLLPYSQDLTQAPWASDGGTTRTANTVVAPDGTTTGNTVTATATANYCREVITVTSNTTYTFSFYAKLGTITSPTYGVYDGTNSTFIVSSTSYASQINANTWSRVSVTFTTPATCTSAAVYVLSNTSNIGTVYIWGAQLEALPFASSYIPTTSTTASRSVDSLTYPAPSNASSLEGSASAEVIPGWPSIPTSFGSRNILDIGVDILPLYFQSSTSIIRIWDGTVARGGTGLNFKTDGSVQKVAAKWSAIRGFTENSVNGVLSGLYSFDGAMEIGPNIGIGKDNSVTNREWFGNIRNVKIFSKPLPDNQLTNI